MSATEAPELGQVIEVRSEGSIEEPSGGEPRTRGAKIGLLIALAVVGIMLAMVAFSAYAGAFSTAAGGCGGG